MEFLKAIRVLLCKLPLYGSSHGSQTSFVDIIEKFVKQPTIGRKSI